jgi:hypothetical protein
MLTRMGREVEIYSDWTDHLPEKNRYRSGSGYLLGVRLAMTAAHVVCPTGQVLASVAVQVRAGAGPELLAAKVVWRHPDPEVDVALLEITDPGWPTPVWRHRVRWGRLVTTRTRQRCEATGFPRATATPFYRDSHTADGLINPKSLTKSARYAVEVTNPPDGPDPPGSRWAGMSGAGVLCDGLLVAVVVEDPAGFSSQRLVAVPIASVVTDPGFSRLVAAHCGRPPLLEPVEFVGLGEPVPRPGCCGPMWPTHRFGTGPSLSSCGAGISVTSGRRPGWLPAQEGRARPDWPATSPHSSQVKGGRR